MKVMAWKNIDLECEVDVQIEDVVKEMMDVATSEDGWRRKLAVIDGATRVLEKIGSEPLSHIAGDASDVAVKLRERLAPILKWCDSQKGGTP